MPAKLPPRGACAPWRGRVSALADAGTLAPRRWWLTCELGLLLLSGAKRGKAGEEPPILDLLGSAEKLRLEIRVMRDERKHPRLDTLLVRSSVKKLLLGVFANKHVSHRRCRVMF
jgi:hypothetical protein